MTPEDARKAVLVAEDTYSLACAKVYEYRRKLPSPERMDEVDERIWKLVRLKQSEALKELNKARKDEAEARSSSREKVAVDKLQRIKEFLEDINAPLETERIKERLNPEGKSIEEVPWMKAIADAVRNREAAKSNPEDVLEDGLEIPPWEDPEMLKPHPDNTAVVPIEAEAEAEPAQKEQEN